MTLIRRVVMVNNTVRLTVMAVLKKFGNLKNEVAQLMTMRRKEGRKVVIASLVKRLLNTITNLKALFCSSV